MDPLEYDCVNIKLNHLNGRMSLVVRKVFEHLNRVEKHFISTIM